MILVASCLIKRKDTFYTDNFPYKFLIEMNSRTALYEKYKKSACARGVAKQRNKVGKLLKTQGLLYAGLKENNIYLPEFIEVFNELINKLKKKSVKRQNFKLEFLPRANKWARYNIHYNFKEYTDVSFDIIGFDLKALIHNGIYYHIYTEQQKKVLNMLEKISKIKTYNTNDVEDLARNIWKEIGDYKAKYYFTIKKIRQN